jgi:flagellar biosynthetic protein FlhB
MSEDSGQEKTERATPRRLEQSREDGQVARSRELPGALLALAAVTAVWLAGDLLLSHTAGWFAHALRTAATPGDDALRAALPIAGYAALPFLPWLLLALIVGVGATIAIGGWNLAPKALALKGERLDPIKGLQRMFGARAWVELGKTLLKFLVVAGISFFVIWWLRDDLARLPRMEPATGFATAGSILIRVMAAGAAGLLLIAIIDVPWQLHSHAKQLRMTREEVRREAKETDGKPEVKAKQRQLQAEMARGRMIEAVPAADVVITNPVHVSVALVYDQGAMRAPRVVAKGVGELAAEIRRVAAEHGVPLLEAPPLARALYRSARVGEEIPASLYAAVAEVLTWVYKLRLARPGAMPERPQPSVPAGLGKPIE